MKNTKRKVIIYSIVGVLVAGLVGFGIWRIIDLNGEVSDLQAQLDSTTEELNSLKSDLVQDPNTAVSRIQQEQNSSILEEIALVYAIPENETPTIATVQDITKLADQPFFEGAENGDILVVFDSSSQAILYRPSSKQLVKVGPISTGTQNAETPAQPSGTTPEPSPEE